MKITKLTISNVLGLVRADLELKGVNVISGGNGAGKSSLADCFSMAMLGTPRRVDLKKEYGKLLNDGADKGRISLVFEGENGDEGAEFRLPNGEHLVSEITGAQFLPYVLDPAKFAQLSADERRTMLFNLTGIKPSGKVITEKLEARGIPKDVVEEFAPMLRGGFPAASKEAYGRATQAKGAWRQITGENWGSEKAQGWKAPAPEGKLATEAELEKIMEQFNIAEGELKKGVAYVGGLEAKLGQSQSYLARKEAASTLVGQLSRRKAKQAATEKDIGEWEPKLAGMVERLNALKSGEEPVMCPCCQEPLKIAGNTLEKFTGLKADVKARTELATEVTKARNALDMLRRTLQNDMAAVAESEAAAKQLEAIQAEQVEVVDEAKIQQAKDSIADITTRRDGFRTDFNAKTQARAQAQGLAKKNEDAAAAHEQVKSWLAVGDALAPDGIPGELLSDAMAPVNQSVKVLAGMIGWPTAEIGSDMAVTYGARAYGLCSESEQWRADCLLALAIAQISQLRLVVLDRFDVLEPAARPALVKMLMRLEKLETMDTMLMVGTMKEMPKFPASVGSVWVNNGIAEMVTA